MNDIIFSNSFVFRTFTFDRFHYTDNRTGVPNHFFAYMLCGKCKIATKSETVNINEGDIFYIPDKCSYQSYWYGNPDIKFISLGFRYFPNFKNKFYPIQIIPNIDKTHEFFCLLSNKTQLSPADIGIFYTLAGILIPSMTDITVCRTKEIVQRTEEYLIQHPFSETYELAKNFAISESTLYSAFKKSSDITLNQLKNKILLEKAKKLIVTTDKSIEYISDLMHFSSASYFRKKFRVMFNMSPREMRKKYQI